MIRALLFAAALLSPAAASAHAVLIDSTPAANATVPPGPAALKLRFNSRIDRQRSRLTLTPAGGAATPITVPDQGPPDVMTAHTDLQPGKYSLRWQVLAVDGHITRGDVPFTVAAPTKP